MSVVRHGKLATQDFIRPLLLVLNMPVESGEDLRPDDGEEPKVPEGVLRGIRDLDEGNTVSKEELESVLKF